jgi:preprotein translocase subunit YajC
MSFLRTFVSFLALALVPAVAMAAEQATPPGAAPPGAAPGAAPEAPGGGAGPGSGFGGIIVPMVLCFAVIYFIVMLPERKKQKARQAMIRSVKKGDKVITTAGIIGKAVKVDEKEVTLLVSKDNDVRMQFMKSAIHEVIPEGTESASEREPGK